MIHTEKWRNDLSLAVAQVEKERALFLDHQQAWRENNHWHANEILRLRAEISRLQALIGEGA